MTMNYQMESSHVAEYDLYTLPGVSFTLRGPQWPLEAQTPCVSFLGAAQTFGAFCKYPFPNVLGDMLSARILNFARGGAGPGFYSKQTAVLEYSNSTDCCVVQIMSARSSIKNAYMESLHGLTRVRVLKGPKAGHEMLGDIAYRDLGDTLQREDFFGLVEETRQAFIDQFRVLAEQITVPKILLYIGKNAPIPDYKLEDDWESDDLIGTHPNMISRSVVARISEFFDDTILSYGSVGCNQKMMNRFTGGDASIKRSETDTITRHNTYISPYLHTRIALDLYEPVNKFLPR